jgi:hypothetical protein
MDECRMVLFKTVVSGVIILAIAVLLFNYGGQIITMTVQNTQRTDIEPHVEFLVGDVVQKSYMLPAAVTSFGVVKITQAPTNQSGDISFLVFDETNFQKWNAGSQADSIYSPPTSPSQGEFNFTFATTKSGAYHFVFDNRASLYKKYIVFSLAYNQVVKSQVPDSRLQYVAWGTLLGGGALLLVGLVRRPPLRWA